MKLPKIKPKIKAFLLNEDGKISKKSVIKAGIVLGSIALCGNLAKAWHNDYSYMDHNSVMAADYAGESSKGEHYHHSFHMSHNDHHSY